MTPQAMRTLLAEARVFFGRLVVLPFELAIAVLMIYNGVAAFFGATIFTILLNDILSVAMVSAINTMYIVSGLTLILGIGWRYRNIEAFGLIFLAGVFTVRTVAVWLTVGWMPVTSTLLVQSVIFSWAGLMRLAILMKNWNVALLKTEQIEVLE